MASAPPPAAPAQRYEKYHPPREIDSILLSFLLGLLNDQPTETSVLPHVLDNLNKCIME
jgi:hypothetical protein